MRGKDHVRVSSSLECFWATIVPKNRGKDSRNGESIGRRRPTYGRAEEDACGRCLYLQNGALNTRDVDVGHCRPASIVQPSVRAWKWSRDDGGPFNVVVLKSISILG